MKILVADDDAISRSVMRRMLVQSGYEVVTVTNGTEAIEQLTQHDGPRLVLLDWMMPGLNGPEVCRALRGSTRRAYVYVTLLTSRDSKEDLIEGLEAGADDYLTKPCNLEELRARLRTGERILHLEDILIEAREEMRFKATHDALTLLLDRGAIMNELVARMESSWSLGKEFSVMLCDVDHFKSINDQHGHPVGDQVLREIAHRLRVSVREGDAVGRYGGEEFLLILNGCGRAGLEARSEAIRSAFDERPIHTSAGPLRISVSAGALTIGAGGLYNVEQILIRVDRALYRAKQEGRDRVVITALSPSSLTVM